MARPSTIERADAADARVPVTAISTADRARTALVAFLGALPTLIAIAFRPEIILDDLQFAAIARFDGFAGFVDEMSYRPGQGLLHGLQFTILGTNAALHLVVLAIANAVNAALGFRLLRHWCSVELAGGVIAVWLLLPDRGSTRFWISTVPNHVALTLVLLAALVVVARRHRLGASNWLVIVGLLVAAILTYEAVLPLGVTLVALVAADRWADRNRLGRRWMVAPGVALGAMAVAGLFVLIRSPRVGASSFLAAPLDGVLDYLTSLDTAPLGPIGLMLIPASVAWVVLDRRPSGQRERIVAVVGMVMAAVGLSPFLVAGFNVANVGVLDRSLFFAGIGTALLIGPAVVTALRGRDHLSPLGRRVGSLAIAVVAASSAAAVFDDLGPYRSAWADQRSASAALADWVPDPSLGTEPAFVLHRVPIDDGVAWAHYGLQVQNLYQLVNDDPQAPAWLGLTWNDELPDGARPIVIVDGNVVEQAAGDR